MITKSGTRVLMEQFALRSREAKFVGECMFNYPMDTIRNDEQTLRCTALRFKKKKKPTAKFKLSIQAVALKLTSLF